MFCRFWGGGVWGGGGVEGLISHFLVEPRKQRHLTVRKW